MNKILKKILLETSYNTGKYILLPEFASLVITHRCNFRCKTCDLWKKNNSNELSDQDWFKIIADLKSTLKKDCFIEINGGEPLIRKDLTLSLIKQLKQTFTSVALNSNGSLIDEETISKLEKSGLDILKISLYSINQNTHNSLRGVNFAYIKSISAIEAVLKSQIKLEIAILITSENINEIENLIKHFSHFKNISFILQPLDEKFGSNKQNQNNLPMDIWPEKYCAQNFFDWIIGNSNNIKNSIKNMETIRNYYLDPSSSMNYRCFAGQRTIMIFPGGDVSFCFKQETIGNLKDNPLHKIINSPIARNKRLAIKRCPKFCRIIGCNFSLGIREFLKHILLSSANKQL